MIDFESKIDEAIAQVMAEGEKINALFKAEWEARRDSAKTLISLSGATLVFTITFSQSVIKPDTPIYWRYAVVGCWLAFICSLVCSLGSLWFSMTLAGFPIMITQRQKELRAAFGESLRTGDSKKPTDITMQAFKKTARHEMIALWLLRFALIFYGIALCTFTAIGLYQMLR
jgi:hypothetical protein